MNRDDIIRMAQEAGFIRVMQVYEDGSEIVTVAPIEELTRFAELVAAVEREECAKCTETYAYMSDNFNALAAEIRARGKK